jgi:hypothetical protein
MTVAQLTVIQLTVAQLTIASIVTPLVVGIRCRASRLVELVTP